MPDVPLADWPRLLIDPGCTLAWDAEYSGHMVRVDPWIPDGTHVRNWHVLYVMIDGDQDIRIGNERVRVQPGTLLWTPLGRPLGGHWPEGMVHAEIWFRLTNSDGVVGIDGIPRLDGCADLVPAIVRLADEVRHQPLHWAERCRVLLADLLLVIDRRTQERSGTLPGLSHVQRSQMFQFLREDPYGAVEVSDVAKAVGLSHDYFTRLFRISYGDSPRVWLARWRMHQAARLLRETALPVHAVAERCGYSGPAAFCRQFQAVLGTSPMAYRRS